MEADAKTYGYVLIPDTDLLQAFLEGLKTNEDRYGYPSCPCRLATGKLELDRDIICPCDYRDPDITQYGACYCRLFVNKDIAENKKPLPEVPERRPQEKQERAFKATSTPTPTQKPKPTTPTPTSTQPQLESQEEFVQIRPKLWYCKQCGYVVFREDPPYMCPICKAKREMFAEIKTKIDFYS